MKRHYITLGSYTTAGGVVVSASSRQSIDGVRAAVENDKIACPSCKSTGYIVCTGPRIPDYCDGKAMALENDFCVCGCVPPPRLIPTQGTWFQTIEGNSSGSFNASNGGVGSGSAMQTTKAAENANAEKYDEQTHLHTQHIKGIPYFIETKDGRTFSGRVGADGKLPRIDTSGEDAYTVLWGDEALLKMQKRK